MNASETPSPVLHGAVIFDRDGVLNLDKGYVHRPDQFEWTSGAIDAVRAVNQAGLYAFVATNQSGVARGYYAEADVIALHAWMSTELAKAGARIDAYAYCPHHVDGIVAPYVRACAHRKPGPGMILDLMARFPVDPARALMIGDTLTDMQAAAAAAIKGVRFEGGSLLEALTPHLDALKPRSR